MKNLMIPLLGMLFIHAAYFPGLPFILRLAFSMIGGGMIGYLSIKAERYIN